MSDRLDLFGWDTVFAVSYAQLNTAIINAKSTPSSFDFTDSGLTISGTWAPWQLTTGGDGQNLQMHCAIATGSASMGGADTVDLTGNWVQIQVRLDRIPDPAYPYSDPTGSGGTPTTLPVNGTGTQANPAVAVIASSFTTGLWKYILPGLFASWFNAHIGEFNQVFSVTVLDSKADTGDYQWLKPTDVSYACADAADQTLEHSVFASLCLAQGRTIAQNPTLTHEVDPRLLSSLAEGANSTFAIAPERVLEQLLLPGAVNCLQGSQRTDFDIVNDNLWLTNNRDITWGNFELDNGDQVSPTIAKGNFQLGLQDQYVTVSVTDATFDWPSWKGPGHITVHMTYTQQFEFGLQKSGAGYVFVPKPGVGTKSVTASVVSDQGVLIFDIVVGIASAVALSVIGGVIGARLGGAASAAVESSEEGAVEVGEQGIQRATTEASQEAVQTAEREASQGAAASIENAANPSFLQKFSSALLANKWKIFGGIVGGIVASPIGLTGDIVKAVANGDLGDIPPFDHFAAACVGATTFPGAGTGWQPIAAGLSGPLLIQGSLTD